MLHNIINGLTIVKQHMLTKGLYQSLLCTTPQILAGMVQGSTIKNRRRFQTTTVHVNPQGRNGKGSNARRMVWVVRRDVLKHALHFPEVMETL